MFYKLIENKRDEWLSSDKCPVKELIGYITKCGMMRDAQIEAIKTYLYLKIECENRPLYELFTKGYFNNVNLDEKEISNILRDKLKANPAARALYEYSIQKDSEGRQVAPNLEAQIKNHFDEIDFNGCFRRLFYGVNYPDYIFSLPMGAGKTFLMAAFIYIDLYFASLEPENPVFAHNFLVLIPSGLKTSIINSLREIQDFDPSWVIPDPAATELKRMLKFEVLDEQKTASKSILVRNPNAQKINTHQPYDSLMGLVAVVNAEKVIIDRVDRNAGEEDTIAFDINDDKAVIANELREVLSKLPGLSLLVDEVHHASDDEIKLRKVINYWVKQGAVNSVLGFSGTPFLPKSERIAVGNELVVRNKALLNVVYYYPLIKAIGNFLKTPKVISINTADADEIVLRRSVTEFFDKCANITYPNGCIAKQAIYCASIERLEKEIYPIVAQIASERGYDPTEIILKYHRGNKEYKCEPNAGLEFQSLDLPSSKIRIILLVQIGKEGWNCKSLTSIVLPHDGACPPNMVLQTSCRCLRQVQKGAYEPAIICLNQTNAGVLNDQLKQQQNTSIQEINDKQHNGNIEIHRYSRMDYLKVPPIDFYQLKVEYTEEVIDDGLTIDQRLANPDVVVMADEITTNISDFKQVVMDVETVRYDESEYLSFNQWLMQISKEGLGFPTMQQLRQHIASLQKIYEQIVEDGNMLCADYDQIATRSNIRKCFSPRRKLKTTEETVYESASLLQILTSPIFTESEELFVPKQEEVKKIVQYDKTPYQPLPQDKIEAIVKMYTDFGQEPPAELFKPANNYSEKEQTYHYLPYHFDSKFEVDYFSRFALPIIKNRNLELYFNGDDQLTNFKIKCYERRGDQWNYIGGYVPDFLLISRKPDGCIDQICIIETKGNIYAQSFESRRKFMSEDFVKQNNDKFGYKRFEFLYIEDSMSDDEKTKLTLHTIEKFFNQ